MWGTRFGFVVPTLDYEAVKDGHPAILGRVSLS